MIRSLALVVLLAACGTASDGSTESVGATVAVADVADAPSTETLSEPATPPTLGSWPAPPDDLCGVYADPEPRAELADERLVEVSGIAPSRVYDGVIWMHNDSGDGPVVYAVGGDGATSAAYNLGALTLDPEDIGIGPGPAAGVDYLYLADVGDNFAFRPVVSVYRIPEPDPAGGELGTVERIDLVYPDGPHNAEAVSIDTVTGNLILITKSPDDPAIVFMAPASELVDGAAADLVEIARLDLGASVTAVDVSPSGDRVAVRGYDTIWMFARRDAEFSDVFDAEPCQLAGPRERQGEAIGTLADGTLITVSEGPGAEINVLEARG